MPSTMLDNRRASGLSLLAPSGAGKQPWQGMAGKGVRAARTGASPVLFASGLCRPRTSIKLGETGVPHPPTDQLPCVQSSARANWTSEWPNVWHLSKPSGASDHGHTPLAGLAGLLTHPTPWPPSAVLPSPLPPGSRPRHLSDTRPAWPAGRPFPSCC